MTEQERAENSAAALLAEDAASRSLGIMLEKVSPGHATCSMRVGRSHLNGHGICHGGMIFTLADTAFAVACNSYNQKVVAQQTNISYLAPARENVLLVAKAREVSRTGRSGVYDVVVLDGLTQIALFRGTSRQVGGPLVPDLGLGA